MPALNDPRMSVSGWLRPLALALAALATAHVQGQQSEADTTVWLDSAQLTAERAAVKPLESYPAGDLWTEFCTEPLHIICPCGRNACAAGSGCGMLEGVNAKHPGWRSWLLGCHNPGDCHACSPHSCGCNSCATSSAPAGQSPSQIEVEVEQTPFVPEVGQKSGHRHASSGKSRTVSTGPVQPKVLQPKPLQPNQRRGPARQPATTTEPQTLTVSHGDVAAKPTVLRPLSATPLAPAELIVAMASDSAEWVEGVPESEAPQFVQPALAVERVPAKIHRITDMLTTSPMPPAPRPSAIRTAR